jgi:hypothetical protein
LPAAQPRLVRRGYLVCKAIVGNFLATSNFVFLTEIRVPTLAQMSQRKYRCCEAAFCDEKHANSFLWPKDDGIAKKWTSFVKVKRRFAEPPLYQGPDKNSRLCSKHFDDECFTNLGMYKQGLISK